MAEPGNRCPGPISRRGFLRAGALGTLGLSDLLRLRAQASEQTGRPELDTAVILVWLPGGPPHMETYDLKPNAPSEYRGLFQPIPTVVPGLDVCEYLPLHARMANQFNIIRSVAHEFADHGGGHKRFLTGRHPASPVGFENDAPMVGSIVSKLREGRDVGLPNYIAGVDAGRGGVDTFSFGAAYLGQSTTPFLVSGDPNSPTFKVDNLTVPNELRGRLEDRARMLSAFDETCRHLEKSNAVASHDAYTRRAFELLTSPKARIAFDLDREDPKLRDRYGRHPWGQRAILARRLVEAGCSFVTMVMENPIPPGKPVPPGVIYNWDSHAVNGHIFDDAKVRLPHYDQTITALVDDLTQRGLTKRVLLIVTGEFGRTPRISYDKGRPGRDHWPSAMSMLVAGGGMRTGQVIGATNAKGEHPQERPLTPNDLWATMYRHLGIDPTACFPDQSGRPMPILPFGEPIRELLPA
jgi:Protein of unknown function (DUF1501)